MKSAALPGGNIQITLTEEEATKVSEFITVIGEQKLPIKHAEGWYLLLKAFKPFKF